MLDFVYFVTYVTYTLLMKFPLFVCQARCFQNIKIFEHAIEIFHDFHRETSPAPTPTPQRPYDVSREQNRYVTLP